MRLFFWDSLSKPFDFVMSKYMVTDYHVELLQMRIVLELPNLSISDYSYTFDDSYSLLKSDLAD